MQKNIIIAGVGGQGILSIAAIIDWAALEMGLNIKQAEVHGMSQRGGAVQSHLRISDQEIFSDLIPLNGADIIISVEPMEALRYLPFLSKEGQVVTATDEFKNIGNYPHSEGLITEIKKIKNHVLVDIKTITCEIGNHKAGNILMLGASAPYLGIDVELLKRGIRTLFERKGEEIVNSNIKAFEKGMEISSAIKQ
ncbi:MAG: indolepyruvate oxidoreductase subunit beta [Prolixibacteraceae bacterium]|jgi:indolepyruvate ferredoxin oxidoreductase beta subunit|nr:indolepyruvate oxidoreductase subunit beta [Prolixibacteraceae bacterium]